MNGASFAVAGVYINAKKTTLVCATRCMMCARVFRAKKLKVCQVTVFNADIRCEAREKYFSFVFILFLRFVSQPKRVSFFKALRSCILQLNNRVARSEYSPPKTEITALFAHNATSAWPTVRLLLLLLLLLLMSFNAVLYVSINFYCFVCALFVQRGVTSLVSPLKSGAH